MFRSAKKIVYIGLLICIWITTSCVSSPAPPPEVPPETYPTRIAYDGDHPTLAGAGDIANCDGDGDEATADLLDTIPGSVFTLGDNVYKDGRIAEFENCYEPSWGRHKERTLPSAGNHEYHSDGKLGSYMRIWDDINDASGYFEYFGANARNPEKGYYSYDIGSWHVVVLNTNCFDLGSRCESDSPQAQWLREDLESHPTECTLAYFHHPLFSSGASHGGIDRSYSFWNILYEHGTELILNGHSHVYERFAAQNPDGQLDEAQGIRQFIVGTGGNGLYDFSSTPAPNSKVRYNESYGVLRLDLYDTSFTWEFIPVTDTGFSDSGSSECH